MKRILSLITLSASSVAFAAFTPPAGSVSTVSVNSSNQLVAPTASSFLSANPEFFPTANIKTLTFGTGLNTGSYAVTTAATASIDTTWLTNNYHKTLTRGTGLTGDNYNGTAVSTFAVDTTWLSNNYHKTLTRGTGLTGDNYNGTAATTFAVDTTWLTTNYHKNLTVQNGVELTDGTTYNGQTAKSIQVDKVYMLAWANGLKRDFYVYVDMEAMLYPGSTVIGNNGVVPTMYSTSNTSRTNVFYYKDASNNVVRTVSSSGGNMPSYTTPVSHPSAVKPTDIELKVLDKYGNIVYYTATITLNSSTIKGLHPEITDNAPTIYYFDNQILVRECYGTKVQFTNFNSYIGASTKNVSGIWVYPSIDDATLCNGAPGQRPKIPIYTGYNSYSGYYPNTTKWGDYVRSVMENPENIIIVWRKSSLYPESMPAGVNYWRPVQLTYYGNFHD